MICQRWRTREDGVVLVQTADGAPEILPVLSAELAKGTDRVPSFDLAIDKWEPLCVEIEDRHGLPRGWLLAMGWRESGWNPRAFRREPKPADEVEGWTGIGVMQLTHPSLKSRHKVQVGTVEINGETKPLWQWQGGYSDEALFDVVRNLEIAAGHLIDLVGRYGRDFPKVSAAYNAGSVRQSSSDAWCMVQTAGHVQAEVMALNYYLLRDLKRAADRAVAMQFGEIDLLGPDFDRVTLPEIDAVDEPTDPGART